MPVPAPPCCAMRRAKRAESPVSSARVNAGYVMTGSPILFRMSAGAGRMRAMVRPVNRAPAPTPSAREWPGCKPSGSGSPARLTALSVARRAWAEQHGSGTK